jgi:predicted glutamine amidotransferase
MCRLLAVHDSRPFDIGSHVAQLAAVARNSREYQGDGWGCAWLEAGEWCVYRNIRPVWEDDLSRFGRTTLLLAHARSAFRNEGLDVANNMPFITGREVFIFNGEMRGVRIRAVGRIGAEKLFHFLMRFNGDNRGERLRKALDIVKRRSRYIRAMNFILARPEALWVHACFSEAPEYFTMHKKQAGAQFVICSEPYPGESGWTPLPNHYLEVRPC